MAVTSAAREIGFEKYPYPDRVGSRKMYLGAVIVVILGAWVAVMDFARGEWFPAVLIAWFTAVLGLACMGIATRTRPSRAAFRYLNAVVMTRAEKAPRDSWVHVAQTRAVNIWLLLCLTFASIGFTAAFVMAALQLFGVIPHLNERTSSGGLFLATILVSLFAAISIFLTYLNIARGWRNGRFGARPSGIALGEHTVSVRVPGRDVELPWNTITAVKARLGANPAKHGVKERQPEMIPLIELELASAVDRSRVQFLAAYGYTVPTDALWSALRWYHAHPESRWELGRIEGQRRIEGWRRTSNGMR